MPPPRPTPRKPKATSAATARTSSPAAIAKRPEEFCPTLTNAILGPLQVYRHPVTGLVQNFLPV